MPRNAPAPLGAEIVTVAKGAARPLPEPVQVVQAAEPRIGITVRLPESMHERLRQAAFEQRTTKQQLIEQAVAKELRVG